MMKPRFWRTFKIVAAVHFLLIGAIFFSDFLRSCMKKKEFIQPIEFLVEVPPAFSAKQEEIPYSLPDPKPISQTIDKKKSEESMQIKETPQKQEKLKQETVPRKKPTIERSTNVVVRTPSGKPPIAPLTEEQIRKLLDIGAKPSNRTVIPDDINISFGLVRKAYYDSWIQPSKAEAGDASVEAMIKLGYDGTVLSYEIKKYSGVPKLDESVIAALRQVKRISGLSPDFVSKHPVVTVLFKLE